MRGSSVVESEDIADQRKSAIEGDTHDIYIYKHPCQFSTNMNKLETRNDDFTAP